MRKSMISCVLSVALATVVIVGLAGPASAQEEAYIEMLRADIQANKIAIMTEAMMLTDEQGQVFWPIYRDFQAELAKLDDQSLEIVRMYAANYETLTDDQAKDIGKKFFSIEKKNVSLLEKTYKKVSKEVNPGVAARFVQVENVLQRFIDLQMSAQMPLFPDSKAAE